jgi:diacylglycerol kinase (ATP)
MNCFLILNPRSKSGKSAWLHGYIIAALEKTGTKFDYSYVVSFDSIRQQSVYANRNGYDRIIAVGGDGTINAVISGFYDLNGKRISQAKMGVIYTGTSPDFCKSYGIPLKIDYAINVCLKDKLRTIRIGKIELKNRKDEDETRFFACCANIGIGATIARIANTNRKYMGDSAGTLTAVLTSLLNYKSGPVSITADGVNVNLNNLLNIFIGRTKYIASGIKMDQGMADEDERFYSLVVSKPGLMQIPYLLNQVYSGKFKRSGYLQKSYGKVFTLKAEQKTEVEFDGDPAGFLPCHIELADDSLDLLVM